MFFQLFCVALIFHFVVSSSSGGQFSNMYFLVFLCFCVFPSCRTMRTDNNKARFGFGQEKNLQDSNSNAASSISSSCPQPRATASVPSPSLLPHPKPPTALLKLLCFVFLFWPFSAVFLALALPEFWAAF